MSQALRGALGTQMWPEQLRSSSWAGRQTDKTIQIIKIRSGSKMTIYIDILCTCMSLVLSLLGIIKQTEEMK